MGDKYLHHFDFQEAVTELFELGSQMHKPEGFRLSEVQSIRVHCLGVDILSSLAASEQLCHSLEGRAYKHPGGFVKLVLFAPSPSEPEVRLHIWQARDRKSTATVHDHAWNMHSAILFGAVENTTFDAIENSPSSVGNMASIHSFSLGDPAYTTIEIGKTLDLQENCSAKLPSGSSYHVAAGEFHSSKALEDDTVTLVLQGPFMKNSCRVIFDDEPPENVAIEYLSTPEIQKVAASAVGRCK